MVGGLRSWCLAMIPKLKVNVLQIISFLLQVSRRLSWRLLPVQEPLWKQYVQEWGNLWNHVSDRKGHLQMCSRVHRRGLSILWITHLLCVPALPERRNVSSSQPGNVRVCLSSRLHRWDSAFVPSDPLSCEFPSPRTFGGSWGALKFNSSSTGNKMKSKWLHDKNKK